MRSYFLASRYRTLAARIFLALFLAFWSVLGILLSWPEGYGTFLASMGWVLLFAWMTVAWLRLPHRIDLYDDGVLVFRSLVRTVRIRAEDVQAIRPAGLLGALLVLEHSRGRIRFEKDFTRLRELLFHLKRLCSGVDLKGSDSWT